MRVEELEIKAREIRRDIIGMLAEAGSGHPGGSLSIADILTVLYFHKMRHRPKEPKWQDRDRFVLSKGHGAPALYAVLAEAGYFPKDDLKTLRKLGSHLQGHPAQHKTPGVEASTGSLGTGLSQACGMALAGKLDKKDYRVYAVVGDGECDEGQIWEAAMSAAHYKLDNLCVFLDRNCIQLDGFTDKVMCLGDISAKWKAFGWNVVGIDGHDVRQIVKALDDAETVKGKPTMIVAKTVKGKGVSFMENKPEWHGVAPNKEQTAKALEDLK
ncbi:MAG: transketolase [archaeon]